MSSTHATILPPAPPPSSRTPTSILPGSGPTEPSPVSGDTPSVAFLPIPAPHGALYHYEGRGLPASTVLVTNDRERGCNVIRTFLASGQSRCIARQVPLAEAHRIVKQLPTEDGVARRPEPPSFDVSLLSIHAIRALIVARRNGSVICAGNQGAGGAIYLIAAVTLASLEKRGLVQRRPESHVGAVYDVTETGKALYPRLPREVPSEKANPARVWLPAP